MEHIYGYDETYNGLAFDVVILMKGAIELDRERDQGSCDDAEQELNLHGAGAVWGRPFEIRPSEPRLHALPRLGLAGGEHFFRDWDLEHGLQRVFSVEVGAQRPHRRRISVCVERREGMGRREGSCNVWLLSVVLCLKGEMRI